jgi:hypothetical protein
MLITNGKLVTWENPNRVLDGHALRIEMILSLKLDLKVN